MITNMYSRRINKEVSNNNDVYEYNVIPEPLRIQVIYILQDLAGDLDIWSVVENALLREYGKEKLVNRLTRSSKEACYLFIKEVSAVEKFLDIIELTVRILENFINEKGEESCLVHYNIKIKPKDAIEELNHRFKDKNFGYEYIDGEIIRIDRELTHKEIIKPALNLLYEKEFESANSEFISAHMQYREGCNKENPNEYYKNAIVGCNKAFESTMKIICEKNRELVLNYNEKHSANELINDLLDANIIPRHLENNFHGLKNMLKGLKASLESGLPIIRNKAGHGKGLSEEWISEEFVTYAINLAATNIVLLVNIYKKL